MPALLAAAMPLVIEILAGLHAGDAKRVAVAASSLADLATTTDAKQNQLDASIDDALKRTQP